MSTWSDTLTAAILAVPVEVESKDIRKVVNECLKQRQTPTQPFSKHNEFIALWCSAYATKHGGKYLFLAKDAAAVAKLVNTFEVEHLMRIAKAAWDHQELFACKAANSLTGFMSRINDIRAELEQWRLSKKGTTMPAFQQLKILQEMKSRHPCNRDSTAFDEAQMTADKKKEYAEIKRKILELEQGQRRQVLG